MPIYKAKGKKDGLQKYNVRVNYISDTGEPKQLTRTAYGSEAAKDLERRLITQIKEDGENPAKKMTVQQLFEKFSIVKNPLSKAGNFKDAMSVRPEMHIYTAEEFKQYITVAKQLAAERQETQRDLSEWDFYIFFNIAFYTGLRKGEIHALKWSDLGGSLLSVKRSINQKLRGDDRETPPKNKSSIRTLQMPLPLMSILKEHRERQEKHLEHFTEDDRICGGERCLRDSSLDNKNRLYAKLSGLKHIRIHEFRHSHVSVLANEGINIQEIARRLGHSRVEMTWNTYSHLYPREEERAVDVLNTIA